MNGKLSGNGTLTLVLICGVTSISSTATAQTWDIRTDWSDISNPNGPWSLRLANGALLGSTVRGSDPWATPQPSYGDLPGWFKSNGTEQFGHDWIAGDIVTHTGSAGNLQIQPVIRWTSPMNGVVDISGSVWWGGNPSHFFRANDWSVQLNGVDLTGGVGTVGSGSGRGRGNAIMFQTEGFGGPSALTNVSVSTGDQIQLVLRTNANSFGGFGAYSAATFQISVVPAPGAAALLGLGGLMAWRRRSAVV